MARKQRTGDPATAGLSDARRRAILEARGRQLATREDGAESAARERMLACTIDGGLYGFQLNEIAKVRPFERRGAAPGQARAALGLVVDNGEIRPALDLAALLGHPAPPAGATGWLLLLSPPLSAAFRVEELPLAVDFEPIDGPDSKRARIVGGEHDNKVLVKLSAADLLAAQAHLHHGATAP